MEVEGQDVLTLGGCAGWIIDHNVAIGLAGKWMINTILLEGYWRTQLPAITWWAALAAFSLNPSSSRNIRCIFQHHFSLVSERLPQRKYLVFPL